MSRKADSTLRQWHNVKYLLDLPHPENHTDDGLAVSNCARELVQREFHETDLLYSWVKRPIFQQQAALVAWQKIISFQGINKAFEAPVLREISICEPGIKNAVSIDR